MRPPAVGNPAVPAAGLAPGVVGAGGGRDAVQDAASPNRQVLAANNLLLGTTNLLVLNLPPGWRLQSGIQRPEVDARRVVGSVCWATQGAAHYFLKPPDSKARVDLWARIRPRAPRGVTGTPVVVAGHAGVCEINEERPGMVRLMLRWECPESGRFIELEARGAVSLEGLAQALAGSQCHGA